MKKITKIFYTFILLTLFTFTSCEKWIDTDLNINPNSPSEVIPSLLLPSVEVNMAYVLGGSVMTMSFGTWMQYFNGYDRQALNYSKYSWTSNDAGGLWNDIYATILSDANEMMNLADESTNPHALGVAKICTAVTLGHATDLWDEVPFSEAFDPENPNPAYESQETIYQTIQSLLSEAIVNLQATSIVALEGDLIYDNDTESWIRAAYALKARYALNLSNGNGNAAYTEALGYLTNAFGDNNEDFQFNFAGTVHTESSPIYQLGVDRPMINMCKTFIDTLLSNNDPRLPFYATINGASYIGANIGSDETAGIADVGPFKAAPDAATIFMSYMEQKFIEAECELGLGNTDESAAAYIEAVAASVLKVTGNANNGWMAANINGETGATITLEKIILQKYIALYGQLQSYNDWRRVDLPVLPDNPETSFDIPQRYPWAQNESSYNSNCPEFVPITTPVWWSE